MGYKEIKELFNKAGSLEGIEWLHKMPAFEETSFYISASDNYSRLSLMQEKKDGFRTERVPLIAASVSLKDGLEVVDIESQIPDERNKGSYLCYWQEINNGRLIIPGSWSGACGSFLLSREDLPEQIDVKGASQRLIDLAKEAEKWQGKKRFQNPDEKDYHAILRWVLTGELEPA